MSGWINLEADLNKYVDKFTAQNNLHKYVQLFSWNGSWFVNGLIDAKDKQSTVLWKMRKFDIILTVDKIIAWKHHK